MKDRGVIRRLFLGAGQVVDHIDAICLGETLDEMAADETGAAGHEDPSAR